MKKNTNFKKNKYKVNKLAPLCKYKKNPLFSLEKKSDCVAGKENQPIDLNSYHLFNKIPPFYKGKKAPILESNSPLFQRKKEAHDQFLHFLEYSSHFGRKSRHLDFAFPWHTSMCDKFLGIRNRVAHISVKESLQSLVDAFYCMALILRKGGKVLVVNKNNEFSPLFRPQSLDAKSHVVIETPPFQNSLKGVQTPPPQLSEALDFPFGLSVFDGVFDPVKNNKNDKKKDVKNVKPGRFAGNPGSFGLQTRRECRPATAPLSWVGGCLTNWKEISKSMAVFLYFSKRFGGFIKQNNIHFPRFKKMKNSFQGFTHIEKEELLLKERPQLLFLFNTHESQQILHEATALQIPVVALTDSSTDLSQITYPIPLNPDSARLIHRCLSRLIQMTDRQGGFSK